MSRDSALRDYFEHYFGPVFADMAMNPVHRVFPMEYHVHVTRKEKDHGVDFFLRLENGEIRDASFMSEGYVTLLGVCEAICSEVEDKTPAVAMRELTVEHIQAVLQAGHHLHPSVIQFAVDAMHEALLEAIAVAREPWRGLYTK